MDFQNIAQLQAYLQEQINLALAKEVSELVKDEINMSVSELIYEPNLPRKYERRGIKGGLADQSNMNAVLITSGVLEVTNDTLPQYPDNNGLDDGKSLIQNIEDGYGNQSEWYNKPRPVMKTATEEMRVSGSATNALANGLISRGLTLDGRTFT